MAKIKNNPALFGASGKFGDIMVFRQFKGKTVLSYNTEKTEELTEKQLAVKDRFNEAVIYAKSKTQDPIIKAEYEARMGDKFTSAYSVAVADFLRVPEIRNINLVAYNGQAGDKILIRAVDDFKVVSVSVLITNPDGTVIESGLAVLTDNGMDWEYTATVTNPTYLGDKIRVQVTDLPGNVVSEERTI
ncbi:MAG TPA: hypothetical protein VD908_05710 [Cytophagales bacterium]|nr:hypothetical protein [Cytophagales bacterium]